MRNNNWSEAFMHPLAIAGANILNPTIGQQLSAAAIENRQRQLAQAQSAKLEQEKQQLVREQIFSQSLPDVIRQLKPENMQDATAQLIALGLAPEKAAGLIEKLKPDEQDKLIQDATGGYHIVPTRNGKVIGVAGSPFGAQSGYVGTGGYGGISNQSNANPTAATASSGTARERVENNPVANTPFGQKELFGADVKLSEAEATAALEKKQTEEEALKLADSGKQAVKAMRKELDKLSYTGPLAEEGYKLGAAWNGVADLLGIDKKVKGVGLAESFGSHAFELIAPKIKEMKGALSDKDIKFLLEQIPTLGKSKEGNKRILDYMEAQFNRFEQMVQARKDWEKEYGSTNGFDESWKKWANANPLINEVEE